MDLDEEEDRQSVAETGSGPERWTTWLALPSFGACRSIRPGRYQGPDRTRGHASARSRSAQEAVVQSWKVAAAQPVAFTWTRTVTMATTEVRRFSTSSAEYGTIVASTGGRPRSNSPTFLQGGGHHVPSSNSAQESRWNGTYVDGRQKYQMLQLWTVRTLRSRLPQSTCESDGSGRL